MQLTDPAFSTQADEPLATGDFASPTAIVQNQSRLAFDPITDSWAAGFPLPGMERLEVLLTQAPDDTTGAAGSA